MATDYSADQSIYTYMNSILGQLRSLSTLGQNTGDLYSGRTTSPNYGQSFKETFRNAAGRLGVPESMDAIFEEAAEKYDVPVNLLMAVGKAESGYNADAVSSAGAMGVMQLMPSTAAALGVDNAFDARSNIMGGAKYLSQKLQQYNGDIDLTLAAYNAGSGNVEKYGGVPPFDETINYIRRIREYMGQELSTGKTVTGAASDNTTGQSKNAAAAGTASGTDLTQLLAEYFVGMMRLQMMNKVSSLGMGSTLGSTDMNDSTSLW